MDDARDVLALIRGLRATPDSFTADDFTTLGGSP